MIVKMYAVHDRAVDAFLQPFFSPSLGSAMRSIRQVCQDTNHAFHQNADDYVLFFIGDFDDVSGVMVNAPPTPERIIALNALG